MISEHGSHQADRSCTLLPQHGGHYHRDSRRRQARRRHCHDYHDIRLELDAHRRRLLPHGQVQVWLSRGFHPPAHPDRLYRRCRLVFGRHGIRSDGAAGRELQLRPGYAQAPDAGWHRPALDNPPFPGYHLVLWPVQDYVQVLSALIHPCHPRSLLRLGRCHAGAGTRSSERRRLDIRGPACRRALVVFLHAV